jgi:hypothetical protein
MLHDIVNEIGRTVPPMRAVGTNITVPQIGSFATSSRRFFRELRHSKLKAQSGTSGVASRMQQPYSPVWSNLRKFQRTLRNLAVFEMCEHKRGFDDVADLDD